MQSDFFGRKSKKTKLKTSRAGKQNDAAVLGDGLVMGVIFGFFVWGKRNFCFWCGGKEKRVYLAIVQSDVPSSFPQKQKNCTTDKR
jgi:hypothetical protein